MGASMIRVMTEENFALLDSQIEQAYRRRRMTPAADVSGAVLRIVEHDIALLQVLRSAQMQAAEETRWLRRLKSDIARLARESAHKPARRAVGRRARHAAPAAGPGAPRTAKANVALRSDRTASASGDKRRRRSPG